MSTHSFRRPDLLQVLPERDFFRQYLPNAAAGMVVEDLDLVLRTFGPNFDMSDIGRFRLVELKHGSAGLTGGQIRTFGLIDRLLTLADPEREFYDGFYVVQYTAWALEARFKVNGFDLSCDEFLEWARFEWQIPPREFPALKGVAPRRLAS